MAGRSDAPSGKDGASGTAEQERGQPTTAGPCTPTDAALAQLRAADDHRERAAALRGLAATIEGCDELQRLTVREQAIEALKDKKLSSPAGLVDAALGSGKRPAVESTQGRSIAFPEPEPWPAAVDGAELLDGIRAALRRYLVLPEHGDTAISLWSLLAHCFDCFDVLPLLALVSPDKACGKTTALDLLSALVARPVPTSSITPAGLFRTVEKVTPTLLIDEADAFLRLREELRGILNSGHTRTSAFVLRCDGDDHEPRRFSTWCPKAIAQIGRPPETLESRSIVVGMQRMAPGEKVEHLRFDRRGHLEELRRKAHRWAKDHADALREADPELEEALHGRAADNWRPLAAIADEAGGDWPARARTAALALAAGTLDDHSSHREQLLADLRAIFEERGADRLPSQELCDDLFAIETSPWRHWQHGRELSTNGLARLLKPYGIRPKQGRSGPDNFRGYTRADFEEAWSRYLPPAQPQQPQQVNNDRTFRGGSNRNTGPPVAVGESAKIASSDGGCCGCCG